MKNGSRRLLKNKQTNERKNPQTNNANNSLELTERELSQIQKLLAKSKTSEWENRRIDVRHLCYNVNMMTRWKDGCNGKMGKCRCIINEIKKWSSNGMHTLRL